VKPAPLDLRVVDDVLRAAVREDVGSGDVTTAATIPESALATARYTPKQPVVVCGLPVVGRLLELIDPRLQYRTLAEDGDSAKRGEAIAEVHGSARSILTAERVTLNTLQRMCGIATYTREYVERVQGTRAKVADTRKTAPGLRLLDKYAVACGGGSNHRMGLFDAILIKNNHLVFHESIPSAIRKTREKAGPKIRIEVEVPGPEFVEDVIQAGADVILLDNFTVEQTREAVRHCGGRVPLETSGGITLETIRDYAEAGVDIISVGALTHSPPAADIHLRVIPA
jgi:nicotinate-nucleotide pyrophosphorylase (carboxylating)